MTIIRTIWYLCGLLIVAMLLLSAMTVVPEAEGERNVACVVGLGLAGLLGFAGKRLSARLKRNPADPFLMSKGWSRIVVAAAILMTLVVLFATIG